MVRKRVRIVRRHLLRVREAQSLMQRAREELGAELEAKAKGSVELIEFDDATKLYRVLGRPVLLEVGGRLMPTLKAVEVLEKLPRVVVDMGAVPHICNGADVMAPGVVEVMGEFGEGDVVAVVDERHGKFIAVGLALKPSQEMRAMRKGRVVENVHYVGDGVWKSLQAL